MFGHDDNNDQSAVHEVTDTPQNDDSGLDQAVDSYMAPDSGTAPTPDPAAPVPADNSNGGSDWQHPGVPLDAPDPVPAPAPDPAAVPDQPQDSPAPDAPAQISDVADPYGPPPAAPSEPPQISHHSDDNPPLNTPVDSGQSDDLMDIKQQALQKLTPMVDDLPQTPEDHFRTIMMMIQASDDQSLIPKAYEAANAIENEQARAQALLDVVNEINYFTQPHDDQQV